MADLRCKFRLAYTVSRVGDLIGGDAPAGTRTTRTNARRNQRSHRGTTPTRARPHEGAWMSITTEQLQGLSGRGHVYAGSDKVGSIGQIYLDDSTGAPS